MTLPPKSLRIVLIFLLILEACVEPGPAEKAENKTRWFPVTQVIDGDTFWINDGSEKWKKVRFIGIDCPETRKTRKKEVGYYGKEAKEYVQKRLNGQSVRLEFDVDQTDQYGRLLAYVYLKDGTFLNAELVEMGFAEVMTIPPNVAHADEFIGLQKHARGNRIGMWSEPLSD
ncbi:MAG: thermonuclease family protein [Bacteroidota bacterium]|nr:thermonuclease family protein [Bacteroidota bacterium]MDX5431525.1 thermonuclease family protein [Bacteroidota bacterium]MDX5470246.1 thermonuclease family protein [Bacteroidota bacterium]